MDDVKRGPTPSADASLKKGLPSWKPAAVTDVLDKDPSSRYRWVHKDPDNLAKKQTEGWSYVDAKTDPAKAPDPRIEDGQSMTSVHEKRDAVLMKMPEELAQSRDAYMNEKSAKRIAGLKASTKKELGEEGAEMHGDITVSTRRG
jgi:hypothetical protein